ncbi:MAG: hypothetical protein FWE80_03245 [Oscillospiraceae bacterium]|nr:hypothetical protein [Oscillospiraceae bacterium]
MAGSPILNELEEISDILGAEDLNERISSPILRELIKIRKALESGGSGGIGGGIPDAPYDWVIYGRQNGEWVPIPRTDLVAVPLRIIAPAAGESPSTVAYDESGSGNFIITKEAWAPVNDPFITGMVYTVTIQLTAVGGFSFDGITGNDISINGNIGATIISNKGVSLTLTYTFPSI